METVIANSISIASAIIAVGGFLFAVLGHRNTINKDYISKMETRMGELEAKVEACDKDRKELRERVESLTRPFKILLVEDDEPTRILFDRHTAKFNLVTTHACDGKTALDLFDVDYFDLVLLDIKLPDMTGIDVYREMKMSTREANIVLISGVCEPAQLVAASEFGLTAFVLKPKEKAERGFWEDLMKVYGVKNK